jgi:hypothetical protein
MYEKSYHKYKRKYNNLKRLMDKKKTKAIYLVRHGETPCNKLGLAQGSRNDIEFNDEGIKQSRIT